MIERLYLVWNAELSLMGGLTYVANRVRGIEECALCELTYDGLSEKADFKRCKRDIGLPFDGVYRNRLDSAQAAVAGDEFPCVLAKTPTGLVKLLGRTEIESCAGDLDRFADLLREAIDRNGNSSTA
ncbi:MAG: hypothetical protein K0U76_14770 [Actinomycetia bacterium]|nr:hypothetical protein [Actinomycetes bacterium]MCH9702615.1 hypothetical protein [Actinomycetes bacterium]MCH9759317.1 hypothetical protein [Actinomycetes bacterium]